MDLNLKEDNMELGALTPLQRLVKSIIKYKLRDGEIKVRCTLWSYGISLEEVVSFIVTSAFMKRQERIHCYVFLQNISLQREYPRDSISEDNNPFDILIATEKRRMKDTGHSKRFRTNISLEHFTNSADDEYSKSSQHTVFGKLFHGGSTETLNKVSPINLSSNMEYWSEKTVACLVKHNFDVYSYQTDTCLTNSLAISLDLSIFDEHIRSLVNGKHEFEEGHLHRFTQRMAYLYNFGDDQQFLLYLLEVGIRKHSLWMLKIFFRFLKNESQEIGNVLLKCKSADDLEIGKVVREGIESSFLRIFRKKLRVLNVYCAKSAKNEIQNSQWPDILVVVTKGIKEAPLKSFCGFDVVFRDIDYYQFTDESKKVLQHETLQYRWDNSKLLNVPLDNVYTQELMKKHRNITLISSSIVRSKNFESSHEMHNKDCIVIYCWVKGYIPIGEEAFPQKIKNVDVDIREGACYFAADENFLQIGSKIGPTNSAIYGTLGGFVNIDSSTVGCLTCAHVVCPADALQSEDLARFISNYLIEVENKSNSNVIGSVQRAVFKHSNSREVSVDAALVKISRQHPENGSFFHEINDAQLSNAGFSAYNRPAFTNGAIIRIDSTNYRRPLLKCGASSGLTVGYAHCINVHAAIINDQKIEFETGEFRFHGQLEVLPIHIPQHDNEAANIKFATNGDSGSLVFMIVEDMPPVLKCVGMVTAVTSYGSCLITPIDHVLLDLGLPLNAFCKFDIENQPGSEAEIDETVVDRIVREVTQAISTNFDPTFQTINRRLDALEERNQNQ